ncbi:hypothetical protein GEMRC1_007945 [Eukaryota sp. GEM-RC1]
MLKDLAVQTLIGSTIFILQWILHLWPVPSLLMMVFFTFDSLNSKLTVSRSTLVCSLCEMISLYTFLSSLILLPLQFILSVSLILHLFYCRASPSFDPVFSTTAVSSLLLTCITLIQCWSTSLALGLCLFAVHVFADIFAFFKFSISIQPFPFFSYTNSSPLFSFLLSLICFFFVDRSAWAKEPLEDPFFVFSMFIICSFVLRLVKSTLLRNQIISKYSLLGLLYMFIVTFVTKPSLLAFSALSAFGFSTFLVIKRSKSVESLSTIEIKKINTNHFKLIILAILILLPITLLRYNHVNQVWHDVYNTRLLQKSSVDGRRWPSAVFSVFEKLNFLRVPLQRTTYDSMESITSDCSINFDWKFSSTTGHIPDGFDSSKMSYIIPVFDSKVIQNVIPLIYSIQRTNTSFPISIVYADTNIVTNKYVQMLACLGVSSIKVDPPIIDCKLCHDSSFNLLEIFKLVQFIRVVVIDPKTIVLQNLDHLFMTIDYGAITKNDPNHNRVSSSLLVLSPDLNIRNVLLEQISNFSSLIFPSIHNPNFFHHDDCFAALIDHYMHLSLIRLPISYDGCGKRLWCGQGQRFLNFEKMYTLYYNTEILPWLIPLHKRYFKNTWFQFWNKMNLKVVEDFKFLECSLT